MTTPAPTSPAGPESSAPADLDDIRGMIDRGLIVITYDNGDTQSVYLESVSLWRGAWWLTATTVDGRGQAIPLSGIASITCD